MGDLRLVGRRVHSGRRKMVIEVFDGPDGKAVIRRSGWRPNEWPSPDRTAREWVVHNLGPQFLDEEAS